MPYKPCQDCKDEFYFNDGEEWKSVCVSCFIARKRKQEKEAAKEAEEELKRRAEQRAKFQENARRQQQDANFRRQEYERAYGSGFRGQGGYNQSGSRTPPPNAPGKVSGTIDPEMLKRLVMLCHPDKHGGSEMSLKVSQWLQQVKNGQA